MIDIFKNMIADAFFIFVMGALLWCFNISFITPYDLMFGAMLTASFSFMMIYAIQLFGDKK